MGTVLTLDRGARVAEAPRPDAAPEVEVPEVAALRSLHRRLADQPHLRPGPEVDGLFGALVRLVLDTPLDREPGVLGAPVVQAIRASLHALCSEGEYQLELAWARRIAASPAPRRELARFPYADNYRRLARLELDLLAEVTDGRPRRVAFIGSGPLPLSSLLVAGELGAPVDNVDRDPAAVALGERVARALGSALAFRCADVTALTATDLGAYDVVILAALVGASGAEKRAVLDRLAATMAPGTVLLARSARGLRSLLYPAIDPAALAGFELQTVVHPVDDVVNSVVLARVPSRPGPR
ncbi:MAG TPA: nicotianamine synthase family protein [Acidimicrobiales bacterium]